VKPPVLLARVERSGSELTRILAPELGWFWDLPPQGALVGPGSVIGQVRRLNHRYRLVLPDGVAGTVETTSADGVREVGYGDLLFRLRPIEGGGGTAPGPGSELATAPPRDGFAVTAPTDGIFYRRPTPDAPPFVEVGTRVRRGQPVGLVEVMKTFSHIRYEGPQVPEEGVVVEIRREDGAEVVAGELLLIVR